MLPAAVAAAGVALGAAAMAAINEFVPHEHFFQGRQGPQARALARIPVDDGFVAQ